MSGAKIIPFPKRAKAEPTFKEFGERLRNGDVDGAAPILSVLLGVSEARGLEAAIHFFNKLKREGSEAITKAMQIRTEIQNGESNGALMLLMECYGLNAVEAVTSQAQISKNA